MELCYNDVTNERGWGSFGCCQAAKILVVGNSSTEMGAGASVKRSKASMRSEITRIRERELNILVSSMFTSSIYKTMLDLDHAYAKLSVIVTNRKLWTLHPLTNTGGARKTARSARSKDGSLPDAVEE